MVATTPEKTIRTGQKQTEVGVLPVGWQVAVLGDKTLKIGSGITPTGGARIYKQSGHPFVRSQNVGWGVLLLEDLAYIDDSTHESFNTSEIKTGDVFLNITGASIGRAAVADRRVEGGNVNQHVCIVRPIPREIDPHFLCFFLLSQPGQRQIDSFQAGGNRQGLNFEQIRSFRLPLPPTIDEQRAIAVALCDVGDLIASLDGLIAKKLAIKTGAMQQLLSAKKRLSGFTSEWEMKSLHEGVKLLSGQHVLANHCNTAGLGFPYITGPSDFPNGVIQHSKFTERPGTICRLNDILVTVKGSGVGTMVLSNAEYCISRQLMAVRVTDWDTAFIYYLLLRDSALFGTSATGLIPGLSRGDILNKQMAMPSVPEQTAIAAVLSDMEAEIALLEARRDKAQALKQGMMQQLLTGKIPLLL